MSSTAILSQGVGYGVVCGIGIFFSALMVVITKAQTRYTAYNSNSEEFSTASRSVKPGLIAVGIVSAWTWAATLLQSSAVAYKFGISGTWWYASGASVQVLLFAQLAAKLKLNAPYAHTFLEIIGCRWKRSRIPHLTFLFFGLLANTIVSTMLILGGSATVTDLTGMNTLAACFLIPTSVAVYVMVGGMRATLVSDFLHTVVLFGIILLFVFTTYVTSDKIGSPRAMYDMLEAVSNKAPVAGNAGGSYLTMRSTGGITFGVLNIIGNFGTVFCDQAYWQRAIASEPQTAVPAFLLGGIAWYSVPFALATTLGLAAVALEVDLTPAQVSAGLPAPAAAAALLGKAGAAAMLILLFLAVTSATSAEQVAVSSVLTYDVYVKYINPKATEKQILRCSHICVLLFSLFMGLCGCVFYFIGISMGYLYTLMGCLIGSAVVPVACAIVWKKANMWGCTVGAISGLVLGIMSFLVVAAKLNDGVVTVETTGQDFPMLAGNLISLGVGAIVSLTWSFISPEDFNFDITRALNYHPDSTIVDSERDARFAGEIEVVDEEGAAPMSPGEEKKEVDGGVAGLTKEEQVIEVTESSELPEIDFVGLNKAWKFAAIASLSMASVFLVLIPIPLFASSKVYNLPAFTFWVVISIIWVIVASAVCILLPVWESRQALGKVGQGVLKDIFQGGSGKVVA